MKLQEQVPGEGRVAKKEDQLAWKKLMAGKTASLLSLKEGDLRKRHHWSKNSHKLSCNQNTVNTESLSFSTNW